MYNTKSSVCNSCLSGADVNPDKTVPRWRGLVGRRRRRWRRCHHLCRGHRCSGYEFMRIYTEFWGNDKFANCNRPRFMLQFLFRQHCSSNLQLAVRSSHSDLVGGPAYLQSPCYIIGGLSFVPIAAARVAEWIVVWPVCLVWTTHYSSTVFGVGDCVSKSVPTRPIVHPSLPPSTSYRPVSP